MKARFSNRSLSRFVIHSIRQQYIRYSKNTYRWTSPHMYKHAMFVLLPKH